MAEGFQKSRKCTAAAVVAGKCQGNYSLPLNLLAQM